MGGSHSTRKVTIENPEHPSNVIKVSNNVVERLKGNAEAVRKQSEHINATHHSQPPMAGPPMNSYQPMPQQFPFYMYEPSLTSLQVRQEKEAEIKKNDEHWKQRIIDLQKNHERINKVMEDEYKQAMSDVKSSFPEPKMTSKEPVCKEGKEAVMKCYKEYSKEPMRCAPVVQAFAECVDNHRTSLVANR